MSKVEMSKAKSRDVIIDVTEEEYQKDLADGVEYPLEPGRHHFRRGGFFERHPDVAKAEKKVRVTMYLDSDVLAHFRTLAEKPGAPGYQTLINAALREAMAKPDTQGKELINDDAFIAAIAEKVTERVTRLRSERHRGHAAKRAGRSSF